jgi:rare lipoprotein A
LRATLCIAVATATLAACSSAPTRREAPIEKQTRTERPAQTAKAPASPGAGGTFRRGGGYYLDDGPGDNPPPNLDAVPDAVPQWEPLKPGAMRPYVVMGQTYTPMTELQPYKARGTASWYGRRYHGKQTSSGEVYDMYSMSAAHPVLPIPSYVRVTNVASGKSVIVRVNDRGPFIDSRLIDLSYTAAYKLGVLAGGSAVVEVESILPDASGPRGTAYAKAPSPPPAPPTIALATSRPSGPSVAELANAPDPILAIAAAATEAQPIAAPLSEPTPQSAPPATTVTTTVATTTVTRGALAPSNAVYLQLGAFGSRENAESYLARAKVQVDWLTQMLHLVPRDGMYRVQAGPYASAAEARQAAERVAIALGMRPVVVTR